MELTQKQIYQLMRFTALPDSPFKLQATRDSDTGDYDITYDYDGYRNMFWLFWGTSGAMEFKMTESITFSQMGAVMQAWSALHQEIAVALAEQHFRDRHDSANLAHRKAGVPYRAFGTKSCDYNSDAVNRAALGIGKEAN